MGLDTGHATNPGHKVLSNNDGCVVARSAEAKALGVATGAPWFHIQGQAKAWGLVARSSNYELYADMSARVMQGWSVSARGRRSPSTSRLWG